MTSRPREPLVGRSREIDALREAVDGGATIVTVIGPAGVGKTRLVLELDARFADEDDVCARLRAALEEPDSTLEAVLAGLEPALFVLDGIDAVLPAARVALAAWAAAAPEVRFVVTSRERLGTAGERVVEIAPLAVPSGDELSGDAAECFLRCVRRVRADYAPAADEAAFVAELVRELDGLPLALELAAPRLLVMGPAALLHRVRQSRSLLRVRDARGGPASFDAALESSWQALDAAEREALATLTVFDGGFTVDAAEAVLASRPGAPPALELVQALRERSLLSPRLARAGELRLELLRSVADFVRRRADPEIVTAAAARHAAHFGALAARAGRAGIAAERENLHAVVRRAIDAPPASARSAEPALHALLALGSALDAGDLLERALDATENTGADPHLVGRALALRGRYRRERGDLAGALRDLDRALHAARTLQRGDLEALALAETATALADAGDVEAACDHARRAVDAGVAAGARWEEARALLARGHIEARRGAADAVEHVERAHLAFAALGDATAAAGAQLVLAELLVDGSRHDEARRVIAEATAADAKTTATEAELVLALALHDEGELRGAADRYLAGAAGARRRGLGACEARALAGRALVAAERGSSAEAHALLRAAQELAPRRDRAMLSAWLDAIDHPGDATRAGEARAAAAARHGPGAVARITARAFDRSPVGVAAPANALVVGATSSWFRAPAAEPVSLERRPTLARVLAELVVARRERAGIAVTWQEIQSACWPGERMLPAAGAHRVRVAVSTLRKLGLKDVLRTSDDGYLLDASCPLVRMEGDAP